ncbi:trypsin-like serine protease [Hyalangium versicolor]|uniref:trypsin-like serine protease n=1 Tax=Hyalangium versicolor TaxID=2861190 RepID=UPI001CCDA99C|nr:trypsin-like serine protease [Hyalangium versicolor]
MRLRHALLVLVPLLIGLSGGCGGCSTRFSRAPVDAGFAPAHEETSTAAPSPDPGDLNELDPPFGIPSPDFAGAVVFETVGEPDADNRFPSVVMIHPQMSPGSGRIRECSGVIVAPRLVLTAGHCVCQRRQVSVSGSDPEQRVDGTSCARSAIATVFFYDQATHQPRQIGGATSQQHPGRIRPHPQLEVRLKEGEDVLSSHADLALILLEEPVPSGFRPARLAKTSARLDDTLTRVGFGYDEAQGALDGRRLVHQSKVLKSLSDTDERFLLENSDDSIFRGDDGGPCFREAPDGPEVVGISTTGLGREASMTDLSPFRAWLLREIALAASAEPNPDGGIRE